MTGAERLFDAITEIRGDYVEAAGDYRFTRRRRGPLCRRGLLTAAACCALILAGALSLRRLPRMGGADNGTGANDAAPPPVSGDAGEDGGSPGPAGGSGPVGVPSDPWEGNRPYWEPADGPVATLSAEAEGVAVRREVTLAFFEDGGLMVKDRYLFTAGEDGGEAVIRYDGPGLCTLSGRYERTEGGELRFSLSAGDTGEVCVSVWTDAADGLLSLSEPEGVAPEATDVIIEGRPWMGDVTVMLGDAVL